MNNRINLFTTESRLLIILLVICSLFMAGCNDLRSKTSRKIQWTEVKPIFNNRSSFISSKTNIAPEVYTSLEFSFNPLDLPWTLVYEIGEGFDIKTDENSASIPTMVGTFNLQYNAAKIKSIGLPKYSVQGGDYLVNLVDRKEESQQVFLIKGNNKLNIELDGQTKITSQLGYTEIDITDGIVKEIKFIDGSKFSVVNKTRFDLEFEFYVTDLSTGKPGPVSACSLPGKSYVESTEYWSNMTNMTDGLNAGMQNNIKIPETLRSQEPNSMNISLGETCYMEYDKNTRAFYLSKKKGY